jgi:hypothetical protein
MVFTEFGVSGDRLKNAVSRAQSSVSHVQVQIPRGALPATGHTDPRQIRLLRKRLAFTADDDYQRNLVFSAKDHHQE